MSSGSSRWLVGTAVVVAALVIASLAVGVLAGGDADPLPEDSPEGVVQRYLLALEDDDFRAAYEHLGADLRQACSLQELREQTRWLGERGRRVLLEDAEETEGRAFVTVRITTISTDAPFTPTESAFTVDYVLERQDDAWRFTESPWPLGHCRLSPTPTPTATPTAIAAEPALEEEPA